MNPEELRSSATALLGLAPDADNATILQALQPLIDMLSAAAVDGAMATDPLTPENQQIAQAMKSAMGDATDNYLGVLAVLNSVKQALTPRTLNLEAFGQLAQAQAQKLVDLPVSTAAPLVGGAKSESALSGKKPATSYAGAPSNPRSQTYSPFNINHNAPYTPFAEMFMGVGGVSGKKALDYQASPLGGVLLQPAVYDQIIEVLQSRSVLYNLGIETMSGLADGQPLEIVRNTSVPTVQTLPTNTAGTDSNMTFDLVVIDPVVLQVEVYVPKPMLNAPSGVARANLDRFIRDELLRQIQREQMRQVFYGLGAATSSTTGREILGLKNMGSETRAVTQTSLGTNGATPDEDDIAEAFARIRSSNVYPEAVRSVSSTRTNDYFARMRDLQGRRSDFVTVRADGNVTINAVENWASNIIPDTNTVGSATDCSDIFVADWSKAIMTEGGGLSIELMQDSAFQRKRQVGFLANMYFGFKPYIPEAFEVITGVRASVS